MTSGDIAIVTLAKGAGSLSVPSKTYYMMSAGLPVIAMAEQASEIADLVHAKEIGNVVPPDEPTKLAKTILSMVNDKGQLLNYKKNALTVSKLFTPKNADIFVKFVKNCVEPTK